jgi:hypothetical protein
MAKTVSISGWSTSDEQMKLPMFQRISVLDHVVQADSVQEANQFIHKEWDEELSISGYCYEIMISPAHIQSNGNYHYIISRKLISIK